MAETAYDDIPLKLSELDHGYGPNVHLLQDPYLVTLLAKLGAPGTVQPEISRLVREIYRAMAGIVVAAEFPRSRVEQATRMVKSTPRGVYVGQVIEHKTRAVVVDVARAGMVPSEVVYDCLNHILAPSGVRQDHVVMSRTLDAAGAVTGVSMSGSKVAGDAAGAILLVPDPMGATGVSMCAAVDIYHRENMDPPKKVVLMHLIVTPQYLRQVQAAHPEVCIYAVRLDRGMSEPDVLRTQPGTRWDEEDGLDATQYIVPGGGGFGEILNNAYV